MATSSKSNNGKRAAMARTNWGERPKEGTFHITQWERYGPFTEVPDKGSPKHRKRFLRYGPLQNPYSMKESCPMDNAVLPWLIFECLFQIVQLACVKAPGFVEVCVEFGSFPLGEEPEYYSVTYSSGSKTYRLNEGEIYERSPNCRVTTTDLQVVEPFDIAIKLIKNKTVEDTKSLHIDPISRISLRVETTSTSALFSWHPQDAEHAVLFVLNGHSWAAPQHGSSYRVMGLQPATCHQFTVEMQTSVQQPNLTVTQKQTVLIETAQCPAGWIAYDRSCYRSVTQGDPWQKANRACDASVPGAHLVDIETEEEFAFITSYLQGLSHLLLLWTGLNDLQREGELLWTDKSVYSLHSTVMSALPPNQTDCFALRTNATGPSYYFTGFFCYLPLPYMCHYRIPAAPADFLFVLEEVREMEILLSWSDLHEWLQTNDVTELLVEYREELSDLVSHQTAVPFSVTRVTIQGLSPGHSYLFTLRVMHVSGATRALGSTLAVLTRPSRPRNVTIGNVTSRDVLVYWTAPGLSHDAQFQQYIIRCVEVETGVENVLELEKDITSAVIGGLKPYCSYRVTIQTVTQRGVESCVNSAISVITAVSPPACVYVGPEDVGTEDITVHWEPSAGVRVDGYYVLVRLAATRDSPMEFWVNDSLTVDLSALTPGETYEIGVSAVRNGSRSEVKTILQTLKPLGVQIAVLYEASTHSVVLYVQKPTAGLFDGITVVYRGGRKRTALSQGDDKLTIDGLTPGTVYDFAVYATSRNTTSNAYHVPGVKTCLAPPTNLRDGEVTDTSIEILWDEAEGSHLTYEVICINCTETVMVQKVKTARAVFTSVLPGTVYNLSVRTEKESFRDSPQVFLLIRTAPSVVELTVLNKNNTSVTISWFQPPGVIDGITVSIMNGTFNQKKTLTYLDKRIHHFNGLSPGGNYRITVISTSGMRRSLPATVSVTIIPAVPEVVDFVDQDGNSMYVTWKKPQGYVDGYKVEYMLLETVKSPHELTVYDTCVTIKDLIPGTEYQFKIQSFKESETSEKLSTQFVKRPAQVCSLHLSHINTSSARIAWEPGTGAFDYYSLSVSSTSSTRQVHLPKSHLSHSISGLMDGCAYNVTVERVGKGLSGAAAFLTVLTEPMRPQGVRVTSMSPDSFLLRWAAPSGCADRHHVDVSPQQGLLTLHRLEDGDIQADVFNVTPGTSYTVTVTAIASTTYSVPVSLTVTTNETLPGAPVDLRVDEVGRTSVQLSWTAPSLPNGRILSYVFEYNEVCPWPNITVAQMWIAQDSLEFFLSDLNPGSTYKIKVAAANTAGTGPSSEPLFITTEGDTPGPVTNLRTTASGHSSIKVMWLLPTHPNGLITNFFINVSHADGASVVRSVNIEAEDLIEDVPHCSDAVQVLSNSTANSSEAPTFSPSTAPVMAPPSALWSKPLSVEVDELMPYTSYSVQVSAATREGEGPAVSHIVRTPESAPQDPPQNLSVWNVTPRSFILSWDPPVLITGRFMYFVELHGPSGVIYGNTTNAMQLAYASLTPYTNYSLVVQAEATGILGPQAAATVLTPEDAPGAVEGLIAVALNSTSVRLSWRIPSQPNGLITKYRVLVLTRGTEVQAITFVGQQQVLREANFLSTSRLQRHVRDTSPYVSNPNGMNSLTTSLPNFFPETVSPPPDPAPTTLPLPEKSFLPSNIPNAGMETAETGTAETAMAPFASELPITVVPAVKTSVVNVMDMSADWISYVVKDLRPFTEYTFNVSAFTSTGGGPATVTAAVTGEQVPSSVHSVSYQNITSTSILVTWEPPRRPNGRITHYTVYGLDLETKEAFQNVTNSTSMVLTGLKKYNVYKLRVAASTAVGESPLSKEDDVFAITLEDVPDSAPEALSVVNLTSSSATITWSTPGRPNGVIQSYEILYVNSTTSALVNSTTPRVTLQSLRPYSFYNVSVRAYTKHGHGNQTSKILQILTGEDVPGSPPFNLTYQSIGPSEVLITWQPPLQPNGIIRSYTVEFWNSSHLLNISTSDTSVRLQDLRKYSFYRVAVWASTSLGSGNQTSKVLNVTTPEDVPGGPVVNLTLLNITSTSILVVWDPPLEPNGRLFYLVSLQEAVASSAEAGRFVNRTTKDTMSVFSGLWKYTAYTLRVSAATSVGSSENSTIVVHLTTAEDRPGSPPIVINSSLSSFSFHMSWLPPMESNGLITRYVVVLQGPGGSNTTVTNDTSLTFNSLLPFTSYSVSVAAENHQGVGPSLVLLLRTHEAGPTSPPKDVCVLNHTASSVWLSWKPSMEPNGVVLFYAFRLLEAKSQTVIYQNSSGPSTEAWLTGLKPYTKYNVAVSAFTKGGNGDQYSDPVTFITDETASHVVGNFSCYGSSWDSIQLAWKPPVQPNGNITHYVVRLDNDEEELTALTEQHTVAGLMPDTEYTFHVMAVNSAGRGTSASCTVATQPESVPGPPRQVRKREVHPTSVTVTWIPPEWLPGHLRGYRLLLQLLAPTCHTREPTGCVEAERTLHINATMEVQESILQPLAKYRTYCIAVSARTNAGYGNASDWLYIDTLPGDPDAPPRAVSVNASSTSMKIRWKEPEVLSGPTSYLIDVSSVSGLYFHQTLVSRHGEVREVELTDLTAFTWYNVTVTAFTGNISEARLTGKSSKPVYTRTLEDVPKYPPRNVTLKVVPENVTKLYVTFLPPTEPNGNISAYCALVYKEGRLDFEVQSLQVVEKHNETITAVIEGLKGGSNYSIQIAAVNGAGPGPSTEVRITTGITAPPKPTNRPKPTLNLDGSVMTSPRTITIQMPACFFSDNYGPIRMVQVIVAETGVMGDSNVTNWKTAFGSKPAPYITDEGFPNPICYDSMDRKTHPTNTYTIGADSDCQLPEIDRELCNGPLKPKMRYVFKFRATNIEGKYTDSEYSEYVETTGVPLLNLNEQIIIGVVLSILLLILLIVVIYASVWIHQRQKEGGTYSPREVEIIDTKFKMDHLITAVDLQQTEEKLSQYSSFFFKRKDMFVIQLLSYRKSIKPINKKVFVQHVEQLCANNNAKFQEEFSDLPKLLPDLSTSDANLPWNRSKNRFTNIKPYNNNRVKLLSEPGVPGSDYINASFISGYHCPNEFIATQGPLPGTVGDFWRMMWETRCNTIVMMSRCFEKGRARCHRYWPEADKPISVFGDIVITKLKEQVLPDWTACVLKVERYNDCVHMKHFNFTSWPEHGVPVSSTALVQFVRYVRANRSHDSTTVTVHCSAGVGRTGVFIALDHLLQHMRDHDFVDLYGLVAELRAERMCMVQNLAQYMFLHQSALELLSKKGVSQSTWFVSYSGLQRRDSLDAMEGDVELEWEETTM